MVNDLTAKRRQMEEEAAKRAAELLESQAEHDRLRDEMEAQSAKAAQLAAEKNIKYKQSLHDLETKFEAERNALLAKNEEARKEELEKLKKLSDAEKAQLQDQLAKREAEFRQRMKELEESYEKASQQRLEEEATRNEDLHSEIERLKVRRNILVLNL